MLAKRPLGSTGIEVSTLGLGTVKFGRNTGVKYPHGFELPNDQTISDLLDLAKDLGINLIDTAPAYGHSEQRLGQLLPGKREDWVIISKVGEEFEQGSSHFDFSPEHMTMSIKRSLKRLNTDYLDGVLVHSNGQDMDLIEQQVFAPLSQLKQQGLIRGYGMSSKTLQGGLLALEQSDMAMVTYNPCYQDELPLLDYAAQHNKGILIKKAFASGHINKLPGDNPIQSTLDFILQHQGVSSIILGTLNPKHLKQNVLAAKSF